MDKNGNISLTDDISGVRAINSTISHASRNPDSYGSGGFWEGFQTQNYNCFECALSISNNKAPQILGTEMDEGQKMKAVLNGGGFSDVTGNIGQYTFGETLMSFNDKSFDLFDGASETPVHAATFIGASKNGSVYTWSKNGFVVAPKIQTAGQLLRIYKNTYKIRYFNPK